MVSLSLFVPLVMIAIPTCCQLKEYVMSGPGKSKTPLNKVDMKVERKPKVAPIDPADQYVNMTKEERRLELENERKEARERNRERASQQTKKIMGKWYSAKAKVSAVSFLKRFRLAQSGTDDAEKKSPTIDNESTGPSSGHG